MKWLSSFSGMNDKLAHDNCPICRAKLVKEVKMPLDTDEGLKQLLRDANYLLTAQGPLTLTKQWRRRVSISPLSPLHIGSQKSLTNIVHLVGKHQTLRQ